MKKVFAKLGMPSALAMVFLFGGLFLGSNSAAAQGTIASGQATSPIKTTGTWATPSEAINVLTLEINALMPVLDANPTPALKMEIYVYETILGMIEGGLPVPNAAYNAFYSISPTAGVDGNPSVSGISTNDWNTIYNNMLDLLTN